jgi:TRAP-type uncharacterized transport system fused permease subunit
VPFVFVCSPALLFEGPIWLTLVSTSLAMIGLWGLSVMLEGWYKGPLNPAIRLGIGALSVMALMPPLISQIEGVPGYILPVIGIAGILFFAFGRNRLALETAR